jgi:hypothetical protein
VLSYSSLSIFFLLACDGGITLQLGVCWCAAVGIETPHLAAALIDVRALMHLLLSTRMRCYSMLVRVLQCITKGQLFKRRQSLSDLPQFEVHSKKRRAFAGISQCAAFRGKMVK